MTIPHFDGIEERAPFKTSLQSPSLAIAMQYTHIFGALRGAAPARFRSPVRSLLTRIVSLLCDLCSLLRSLLFCFHGIKNSSEAFKKQRQFVSAPRANASSSLFFACYGSKKSCVAAFNACVKRMAPAAGLSPPGRGRL